MSNLIGPDYDKPCPECGNPMGNAAGLGICSRCDMRIRPARPVLSRSVVPFLEGFQPLELPFIKAPMMKPYRIKTQYSADDNALYLIREYREYSTFHEGDCPEEDAEEFYPAHDPAVQTAFLDALHKKLGDYFHNLKVCCVRFDEGSIGILPLVNP